ncbi:succinate dehydrogenase/fumarate reductase flavoprotein subunit [Allocatelliglobosispora scoriae]|uniref:Succinate dehydrogenase/fumarate reductase flavoprotein subunit n=1 Tax=Allocatelliglobosispora scoriae TaxID=643052 RepID=A0A841BX22_9ACTN|nr:FAD-binding protein [Allocatelliglobosispora scoriae]MBB5872704.1 succinate dehydrogenase/fumarate reductase flavoprotein subunit [Allocatelliglobosispora scoriae]
MRDVDVLVIGSGPGGQKAAVAAKPGRRVAIVERGEHGRWSPHRAALAGLAADSRGRIAVEPTPAESYTVAVLDVTNKMRHIASLRD